MRPRWMSAFLLFAAAWLALPGDVSADGHPLTLTSELKNRFAELAILRGARIEPAELENKAVVVSFFASWCVPCRKGFTEQGKLVSVFGPERVKIVAINWLEDAGRYPGESMRLTRLLDRVAPHITVVEGNKAVSRAFGDVWAIPTVFVFDEDGQEIYRFRYSGGTSDTNEDYEEIARVIAFAQRGD